MILQTSKFATVVCSSWALSLLVLTQVRPRPGTVAVERCSSAMVDRKLTSVFLGAVPDLFVLLVD